jgi:hypothetical protein
MVKQVMAGILVAALMTGGCASASGPRVAQDPQAAAIDRGVMADYAQRLPAGSKVRVERTTGGTLRGTLIKSGTDSLTVQRNTRVPEPPVEIPLGTVTRLTLEQGSSTGKNVAIGIASGVAGFFGVMAILFAVLGAD